MTGFPDVKLKTLVVFPANVVDGTGIDISKLHGKYRIDLAYDDFIPPLATIDDPANSVILVWNTITGQYTLAPTSLLLGAGSAFPTSTLPAMDGTAAVGVETLYAHGDHVHPTDTSRAPLATISELPPSGGVDGDVWYQVLGGGSVSYADTIAASTLPVGGLTVTPVYAPLGVVSDTTVTAPNGQSWTFAGGVTNGTYVNGDPWVLDTGSGVSLTALSTMPTGSGQSARHGGMINPTFNTLAEVGGNNVANTTAMKQGYDGRIDEVTSLAINTFAYDATLNAHASLPKTLHAGDSLCSATSLNPSQDFTTFWGIAGSNKNCLERMAVVTVVGTTPAGDAFRPNYFGTTKYNFTFSGADTALLPNLTAPFNPKGAAFEDFHIDSGSVYGGAADEGRTQTDMMNIAAMRDVNYWVLPMGTSNRRMIMPHFNMQWHSSIGTVYGQLAMYCMCNFSDRDVFLKRILQAAIDAYAVAVAGGTAYLTPWGNGAGYYPSSLWLIRLAGLLFNHTGMKNAGSLASNNVDFYGAAVSKWGENMRVYLTPNATAHAQYARVPGASYAAGFPLYGDTPRADYSALVLSPGSNFTGKDPTGVFDMHDYKYLTPSVGYPSAVPYTNWAAPSGPNAGIEQTTAGHLGTYMSSNNPAMMATALSSIAMGDAAFWPNAAVVPFAKRVRYDPKMWEGWGVNFDSSDITAYNKDIRAHGGTGNGWMTAMWDLIDPPSSAETITPGLIPIVGQAMTPVFSGAGGGPTTVFTETLAGTDPGWGGYTIRQIVGAANLSAATGQQIKLTLGFKLIVDTVTVVAYVGQGSTGGDVMDTTAMVQLTGGDFGSGTYTQVGSVGDVVLTSGWITLNETYNEAKDLVIAVYATGVGFSLYTVANANNAVYYTGPSNEAGTADVAAGSYTSNGAKTQIVSKIEIQP